MWFKPGAFPLQKTIQYYIAYKTTAYPPSPLYMQIQPFYPLFSYLLSVYPAMLIKGKARTCCRKIILI